MSALHKLIPLMLVTALAGGWIGYSLHSDENKNVNDAHLTTPSILLTDNQILIDQLQQEIQQLQSENSQLLHQMQSAQKISSIKQPVNTNEASQHLQDELQALEIEKQQRKADDFGAWVMDSQTVNSRFDLNSELSQRFGQESRDSVWAEQQESHYQQLFSTQNELRDFALRNAECRSTQCEVTVSVSNSEQSQHLLQTITHVLQGSVVLIATDENSGISKLYIGRDEESFEFN